VFFGIKKKVIDKKWRLWIPASFKTSQNFCFLKISDDGCIQIYFNLPLSDFQNFERVRVRKGDRIIIPERFRNSYSFYFGKKVSVVGCGHYLEIWPELNDKKTQGEQL
jgi:DNA-binding transcriptional regulator/RsmH inhibitor MraZ